VDLTDTELIEAVRRGDEQALTALLSRHAPRIYRYGLKMCRDPEDARDVVQDTLLAAARGVRDFRGASSLSTWLYAVARSFCLRKRRGAQAATDTCSLDEDAAVHEAPSLESLPDEAAAHKELGAALDAAITALDPMYREVLVLRDVEGLTAPEVAEVLGLTVEAVKTRLHRARAVLRARLEPFLPPEERTSRAPASGACPDIVALFSRYLEGEIGGEECKAMERHVLRCKRCAAACDSLKHTLGLCRAEPRGEVPAEVQDQVRRALREVIATDS
jgi:RNA polymerase sigma-70 factor (ECF subfamily)